MARTSDGQNTVSSAPYMKFIETTTVYDDNSTGSAEDGMTQIHSMAWLQIYFVPIFYSTVSFLGFIGNGLVIAVLLTFKNMRSIPNIYILNLAIVDFMFSLSLPFIAYQVVTSNWPFGSFFCKVLGGFDGLNQFASIYTLALMSADRYVAVVYPLSSMRYRTKKVARLLCAGVLVFSVILSLPIWIFQYTTPLRDSGGNVVAHYCTIILPEWSHSVLVYNIYGLFLGFVLPLVIIIMCYTTLLMKIVANTQPLGNAGSAAQRAQKRVTFLVVTVIVAFVICWMPYYVVQMINTFQDMTHTLSLVYTISICWCYINSCFNPFMYTFIGENFKRNAVKLLCCERDKGPSTKYSLSGGMYRMQSVTNDTGTCRTTAGNTAATDTTAFIEKSKSYKKINVKPNNNEHD